MSKKEISNKEKKIRKELRISKKADNLNRKNKRRKFVLITVLTLIREWVESEEEIITVKDISMIISKTNDIRILPESVLYIYIITEYWNFIYAVYIRYVIIIYFLLFD